MPTKFVLLLVGLNALPSSSFAASSDRIVKCENIFNVGLPKSVDKAVEKAIKLPIETAQTNKAAPNSSLILKSVESTPTKEIVELKDGYVQSPPRHAISENFVGEFNYFQNALGDQIRIQVYPDANPFSSSNRFNQLAVRSQIGASRNLTTSNDHYIAARDYLLKMYEGRELDETTIRMAVQTILNSPDLLKEALSKNLAIRNSRMIELTNYNQNRYFWFIPEGKTEAVAARVLDIHRRQNPSSYIFLIEYQGQVTAEGVRTRVVQQLTEAELANMQTQIGNLSREDAALAFFESLSPDEIQTTKLASLLKLKKFGYFNINRGPGVKEHWGMRTPLEEMNSIVHLAIGGHIQKTFGVLTDLLTPFEKQQTYVNYLDVFSRLNPKYVMERFGDQRAHGTEFFWIITEDGQLKMLPAMHIGHNLKPQILRLAHGRRVFAGGTFTLNFDGSLRISLNANGYQQADMAWGDSYAFSENNPHVNEFVRIVFGLQAGRKISNIESEKNETWYRADSNFNSDPFGHQFARGRGEEPFARGQDGNRFNRTDEDFFDELSNRANQNTGKSEKHFTWDQQTGTPIDMQEFVAKFGNGRHSDKLDWAHYVLQTDSSMALGDIKKKSRKLLSKFHPDKNTKLAAGSQEAKRAEAISTMVNDSIAILEQELKP